MVAPYLNTTVTREARATSGERGPAFSAGASVSAYLEQEDRLVRLPDGNEATSSHCLVTKDPVTKGDRITLSDGASYLVLSVFIARGLNGGVLWYESRI